VVCQAGVLGRVAWGRPVMLVWVSVGAGVTRIVSV
jgi:hypothetical protein